MRASRGPRSMATPVIGTEFFWLREPPLPRKMVKEDNDRAGKRVVHDHFGEVQTQPHVTTESKWLII
jgi:hypothetical protein